MKYKSELIKEIVETRGHEKSSLHYESECIDTWIAEAKGAYPKLCDYQSEWLNYISILDDTGGEFPYESIIDVTEATVDNVVPYAYKSAVLKGKTDENLQSVRRPVLTTSNEDGTKSNILKVNEDVTLCGISNVRDELNCLTGEVTERIGEMVLNGSENWKGPFSGGATVEGMYYYTYEDTRIKRNTTTNVLTTISYGGFASIPFNSVWKKTQEGISSSNSTGLGLRLATKIASAAELKSYLQQNPTTLKYQLATESIKTVDLNIQDQNGKTLSVIKPIEGKMIVSTSSDTIKPLFSGEIPVEAITQNLASFIDLEMEE